MSGNGIFDPEEGADYGLCLDCGNSRGDTAMSEEIECCASGSCEVCRRPSGGYTPQQRRQMEEDYRNYEPPWMREHRREGWRS